MMFQMKSEDRLQEGNTMRVPRAVGVYEENKNAINLLLLLVLVSVY